MIFRPFGIRCLNATLSLTASHIPKWKAQSPYWKFASSLVSVSYFMATPSDLMSNSQDQRPCDTRALPPLPMEALQFAHLHLADGELHRKCRTVAVLSDNDAADTDNSPLPSAQIPFEIAIVIFPIRHQYFDIFSQHIAVIARMPQQIRNRAVDSTL